MVMTSIRTDGCCQAPAHRVSAGLAPAHQVPDDRAGGREPHPVRGEDVVGRTLVGVEQPEQDVLGADVVVPERDRLAQGELERLLRRALERDVPEEPATLLAGRRPGAVERPGPNASSTWRRTSSRSIPIVDSASASIPLDA